MSDDTMRIPADHPDRYALEYIDARIEQHKVRGQDPQRSESERDQHKFAAQAIGVVRGDIFALLHRPSPVAVTCEHPSDRQLSDSLPNVGATIRCAVCGEHRPVAKP